MRANADTYRIVLAYDGRGFAGFARQPGQRTVETTLRQALSQVAPDLAAWAVAGRTDRGVSAVGQVISFRSRVVRSPADIVSAIDGAAPGEIACIEARTVSRSFHAQFSARSRSYVYVLEQGDRPVDVARLDRMLGALIGRRCFSAFARDTPSGARTVRTLRQARARAVRIDSRDAVQFEFTATSFVRRQVRVMVATSVREAAAGADDHRLVEIAETRDRTQTARPADAAGLTLSRVAY